jgi:hypothetical protein
MLSAFSIEGAAGSEEKAAAEKLTRLSAWCEASAVLEPGGSCILGLVEVAPEICLDFVTLAEQFENLLNHPVELVSRRATKPKFYHRISKDLECV